ncbi:MAG: glycosyltransferase family 1 protein, partial [Planctomycetia bacterium]|nr:glycosyltransferase family 1 protein [Planctomycetia bacterium]
LGSRDTTVAWGRSQLAATATLKSALPAVRFVAHVGRRPAGLVVGWALRRADRVLAATPAAAEASAGLGVAPARLACIPPAADAAPPAGLSRRALAARLGLDPDKQWTLCVAPLEPHSRLERLVWAIDQLGVVHRRLEHVLVGAGPLRPRLLRRARVQQVAERLHLFPFLDCLPDLLREVRLVWQSGEVACGGVLLDGMAVGVPAVAVESDAARQLIVDGETGRIVPADPESEFPRRALGILEDDALAARYAAAAAARAAAEFPARRMVASLVDAVAG